MDSTKKASVEKDEKITKLEATIKQKDLKYAKMKKDFEDEREAEAKIVTEYINAENYLLELVDEFTNGMRKIYANDIEFKDVDIEGLPFCERFSNLLYNILLIIDFQKQFIVEQSNNVNTNTNNLYNNECIIEEADNEEGTEDEGQNTNRYGESEAEGEGENESEDEVIMKSNAKDDLLRDHYKDSVHEYRAEYANNNRGSRDHQDELFTFEGKPGSQKYDTRQYEGEQDNETPYSSENEMFSEEQEEEQSEEPVINKTLVMLQRDLHKSLFSPSLMKINESPKVKLLTDRGKKSSKQWDSNDNFSKNSVCATSPNPTVVENKNVNNPFAKDHVPNIFGMNVRPSSGEIVSPTSESSRHSVRKDHSSKDNRYQLNWDNSSDNNSEEFMSLESIVIQKGDNHKYKNSNNDSVEEVFTPNFITKRSSISNAVNNDGEKVESSIFYKNNQKDVIPYDYRPPLVSVLDSDGNYYNEDEFSESMECSEQMYSSNQDIDESKADPRHK